MRASPKVRVSLRPAAAVRQCGATMVEFALVLVFFLTFLLGILDFSRMLWTWQAASEATRWGVRTAVVCQKNAAAVLRHMQSFLPQLTAGNVVVDWYDTNGQRAPACDVSNCAGVSVRLVDMSYQWLSPMGYSAGSLLPMPDFSSYLPREVMGQDPGSSAVCN
jgi:Flp pilus assembly protein TadG